VTDAEFQSIFDEHKDAIYRFAWRITSSSTTAEDIAQDVFLWLFRHPDRFDPRRGSIRAFLLGVARNLALKRWRDENRWAELESEDFAEAPPSFVGSDIAEIVGRAVRSLPPLQREVLVLAEYEEFSLEEISSVVDAEIETVKSRLHRARENLRRMLAPLKPGMETRIRSHGTIK
jgi:RNA polymerase sigma-70 factor (ECF subfamily)